MILIDGRPGNAVDARDRGLAYGDGLFETIAVLGGQPRHWGRHLTRLEQGCRRLGFAAPDGGLLRQEAMDLCAGRERSVLKLLVTRGVGGRGYRPATAQRPTRVLSLNPWPHYPERFAGEGIRLRLCETRLGRNPRLAGLKHLNRLEQVLARQEWDDPEVPEGLMLDSGGNVVEGTQSNLFLVTEGRLVTPDLSACGVAGIMREVMLEHAVQMQIPSEIRDVRLDEVEAADELFVCNSLIGLWPVNDFAGRRYAVGPIARRLAARLAEDRA